MNYDYRKIFQLFFVTSSINVNIIVYIDESLDYNVFFCFFCYICFSNFDRLIKVFLSACGIHSNVGLSKNHIITFFEAISPTATLNAEINYFIDSLYLI